MSHVTELETTLKDVINAHLDSQDLTLAEMVGILETIKYEFLVESFQNEEED